MVAGIIIWTVVNVALSLSVMFIMIYLYGKSVNLGWKKISFSLNGIKMSHSIRSYMYGITFFMEGRLVLW